MPTPSLARPRLLAIAAITLVTSLATAQPAPDADLERQFDAVWGEAVKRVSQSADRKDGVKLAGQMLELARTLPQARPEDRRTKVYVLRRAQDLAMRDPTGHATAEAILKLLPQVDPALADGVEVELLDLAEIRFRAMAKSPERDAAGQRLADELIRLGLDRLTAKDLGVAKKLFDRAERVSVMSKSPHGPLAVRLLQLVDARATVARAADELRQAHAKQPKAETARKLIELNLLELDDPAEAARYVKDADDAELDMLVPLASKKVAELDAAQCRELAGWYFDRRKGLSASGACVVASRAREWYARYLGLNPPKDLELLRATERAKDIAEQVDAGAVVVLPRGRSPRPAARWAIANATEAAEVPAVVEQLSKDYPDVLGSARQIEVAHVHDATALRCNGGGAKEVAGSYAAKAVEGGAPQIWLWGIYEPLEPGKYVVVYRMKRASEIEGKGVCFVDVCVNGNTIAANRPPASALPPDEWRPLAVQFDLGARTTVEYRLWSHGHTFAVDRIYVLKVAQ